MGKFNIDFTKYPELEAFLQAKTADTQKELYPALKKYYVCNYHTSLIQVTGLSPMLLMIALGELQHLKFLLDIPGNHLWQDSRVELALKLCASLGRFEIMQFLLTQANVKEILLQQPNNVILKNALEGGCFEIVEFLLNFDPIKNQLENDMNDDDPDDEEDNILDCAIFGGNPQSLKLLLSYKPMQQMLLAYRSPYFLACTYGGVFDNRVGVRKYSSDASYYGKKNYREMILVLLSCPGLLAKFANNISKGIRAENDSSLSKYIDWYIDEQLLEIAEQYLQLATTTPNAVLDLNEETALQYYHILIYCIQSVAPSLSSILPFLMAIPSIEYLLIDKKDELLEAIKKSGNQEALKIVITLPAIRNFIEQDDHYCSGAWVSSSLAELFFDITTLPEGYAERQAAAYDGFSKHATSIKAKLHELILQETYAENPQMYDKKITECMKAILIGDLPRVRELLKDSVVSNAIDNSIFEEGSSVLDYAIAGRNVEIVQLILELEKISTTVAVWNNAKLKDAVREGCQEIAEILLNFPQVFALAEKDQDELENYVPCFIAKKLDELKKSKGSELSPRESRLCFYIARHLISQNKMNEELVFLLQLPSVRALAHTSVSFDKPNELWQVAIDYENDFAKKKLLQIPAVKRLVEKTESSEADIPTPKAALLSDLRDYCIQQEKKIKGIIRDSFFSNESIYLKAAKHLMKILDGRKNTYKIELLTPLFEESEMVNLLIKWQIKYDLCHDAILCEKIPPEAREDAELSDYNSLNNNCSDYSFSDGDSSEYDSSEGETVNSMSNEYCSNP